MTLAALRTVATDTAPGGFGAFGPWDPQRRALPTPTPAGFHPDSPAGPATWPALLNRVALLSAREMEVFLLLGKGASNRTIASRLSVAERTVKAHVAQVMAKIEVESRLQAGLVSQLFQLTYEDAIPIVSRCGASLAGPGELR